MEKVRYDVCIVATELPRVYLAGPVSGCNARQLHDWRRELKESFSHEFCFVDPADRLVGHDKSDLEVIETDIEAIRSCAAVLANMWKESVGTAFGVLHAHLAGKLVVVSDPNNLQNRMLAFYADAVAKTPQAALHRLRRLMQSEREIAAVRKADDSEEPFDRYKLITSVRRACIDAKQSDVGPPRAIVLKALEWLHLEEGKCHAISTKQLRDAVWTGLSELASDDIEEVDYRAIQTAWESHESGRRSRPATAAKSIKAPVPIHPLPLDVPLRHPKGHSTIWGKMGAKRWPPTTRQIFEEMCKVEGVSEILFRRFENTGSPPATPHVKLFESRQPTIIEGKCYDKGEKGTMQMFQVFVHDAQRRDSILERMRDHLYHQGFIRSVSD